MERASKNIIKETRLLNQKKFRYQNQLFLVEGPKLISEFLSENIPLKYLLTLEENEITGNIESSKKFLVTKKELEQVSNFKTPNQMLAVFEFPSIQKVDYGSGIHLFLDDIKDPGNLGTIIRLADWYGVESISITPDTVDPFNPKVVQSSMGSLSRVKLITISWSDFIQQNTSTIYTTELNGSNIYSENLAKDAIIVIGSESHGVSKEVSAEADKKLLIPKIGKAESLNAGVATGIVLSEFCRGRS